MNSNIINKDFKYQKLLKYFCNKCINEFIHKDVYNELVNTFNNAYNSRDTMDFKITLKSGIDSIIFKYTNINNKLSKSNVSFLYNLYNFTIIEYSKKENNI